MIAALACVADFLFWAESSQKQTDWLKKKKKEAEYHSNWLAALLTITKDFLLEQELQVKTPGQKQIWHSINNATEPRKSLTPSQSLSHNTFWVAANLQVLIKTHYREQGKMCATVLILLIYLDTADSLTKQTGLNFEKSSHGSGTIIELDLQFN